MIFDSEQADLAGSPFGRELPGEGGIANVDIQLVQAAKLVHTFDRACGKKSKVVARRRAIKMNSVKATADMRETDGTNQTLLDAIAF